MEWSIQQLARLAGVTSRALRHYGDVGILEPSRTGNNGYRYYDERSLARLQRILLLRQLGVGIPVIRDSVATASDADALDHHLRWLRQEQDRVARQIRAVELTVRVLEEGGVMNAQEAFDGFDNSQYEEEVSQRWGAEAWRSGQSWWEALGSDERASFRRENVELAAAYTAAREAGSAVDSDEVQTLVARHIRWIAKSWQRQPGLDEMVGLGEMYVSDERLAGNYGGHAGATYVCASIRAYADLRR